MHTPYNTRCIIGLCNIAISLLGISLQCGLIRSVAFLKALGFGWRGESYLCYLDGSFPSLLLRHIEDPNLSIYEYRGKKDTKFCSGCNPTLFLH